MMESTSTKRGIMGTRAHLLKIGVGLFGLAQIFGVLHPVSVRADTVYVAPGGSGDGSAAAPFGSVQTALDNAAPGDQVSIASGTYSETVETVRNGQAAAPIVLRGTGNDGPVVLTASGRVVRIDHAHVRLENLTIDGQYGDRDAVDVNDGADGLVLRNVEVRHSGRDCLDMGAPAGVLIEDSLIHHCLDSRDGRTDAHGITGGAVTELTVRNTEIHTFSGDGLQFDPGRELPGWNNIVIEGCLIWLAPLAAAENGFAAGTVPGENGVDTKTHNDAPRASLLIRDSVFYGFGDGMISNMAALNLKENVDVEIDRVTLYDSQIALRLRGPTSSRPAGAWVRVANTVIYRVEVAVRYEDDIENLRIWNTTIGASVDQPFVEAAADNSILDVRNLLVLAATLPSEAPAAENLAVGADSFVDPTAGDHHLAATSAAIDSGTTIAEISWDRDGLARPQGAAVDIGAYEWCGPDCEPVADPDGSVPPDGSGATDGASSATDGGGSDGETDGGSAASGHGQSGCGCRTPAGIPVRTLVRTPARTSAASTSPLRKFSHLNRYGLWFLLGLLAVCLLCRPGWLIFNLFGAHPKRASDAHSREGALRVATYGPLIGACILALTFVLLGSGCGLIMKPKTVVSGSPHCCKQPVRKYEIPRPGPLDTEDLSVWPNALSKANSDPWLAQHHDDIKQMRPRILALNFVNGRSTKQMTAHMQKAIAAVAESSRYHGDVNRQAPVFLQYELAYTVDLTDHRPPQGWPYRNSTRYPREEPVLGDWGFDYEQLFSQTYADYYGIADPDEPSRNLTLCELIDRGMVHEVWIYGDGDVPDVKSAEILELKPVYDEKFQKRAGALNRCAGNGCFDAEDDIPNDCDRTVRIAWMNNTRGVGCFLESLSHGFESIAANNPHQIPYLSRYFIPFAGFDMDTRYGVPFDSFYSCDSAVGPKCLRYPSETKAAWKIGGRTGTIDPWDPVCGNVHFTPNSRGHYDLSSPYKVLTSCRTYRAADERAAPFESSVFASYKKVAPDCMGPFLVWWRQQWPGLHNKAIDANGRRMRNWWVFLYY